MLNLHSANDSKVPSKQRREKKLNNESISKRNQLTSQCMKMREILTLFSRSSHSPRAKKKYRNTFWHFKGRQKWRVWCLKSVKSSSFESEMVDVFSRRVGKSQNRLASVSVAHAVELPPTPLSPGHTLIFKRFQLSVLDFFYYIFSINKRAPS